jgi:hypothetical protein
MHVPTSRQTAASAAGVLVLLVVVALGALVVDGRTAAPVAASSGGKIGFSGNPGQGGVTCARCHRGGAKPEVKFSGPEVVAPGSTHAFTLTISGGQKIAGGLDVSTTGGMLRVPLGNDDVREASGEITQVRPKTADANGDVIFHFLWSAPDVVGDALFYGAGNSVDLGGSTSGDDVTTDTFRVVIEGDLVPTATPSEPPFITAVPTTPAGPTSAPTTATLPVTPPVTAEPTAPPTTTPEAGSKVYLPIARR